MEILSYSLIFWCNPPIATFQENEFVPTPTLGKLPQKQHETEKKPKKFAIKRNSNSRNARQKQPNPSVKKKGKKKDRGVCEVHGVKEEAAPDGVFSVGNE